MTKRKRLEETAMTRTDPNFLLEVDVTFQCPEWPDSLEPLARRALDAAQGHAPCPFRDAEISLVFADDSFVQLLNKSYRGRDKPTNVLSFPQTEPEEFDSYTDSMEHASLGDIILAYQTVKREAEEQGKTFEDHAVHLIVHGYLHLLGYDHEEDEEADEMETLETRILESLGIKNPYESVPFVA